MNPLIKDIASTVTEVAGISFKQLYSSCQKNRLVFARMIISAIAEKCGYRPEYIAYTINRSRCNIIHYRKNHPLFLAQEIEYAEIFNEAIKIINKKYEKSL